MAHTPTSISSTVALSGVLTIVFTTLKLAGVIHWSWLWVLSPLWLNAGLFFLLVVFFFIGFVLRDLRKGEV